MQHFLCPACALGQNRGAAQSLRVRQRVGLNTPVESFGHVLLPCQIQIGSTVSGSDLKHAPTPRKARKRKQTIKNRQWQGLKRETLAKKLKIGNHPRTEKRDKTVHWQAKRGAVTSALSTETHASRHRHKEHQWTPADGFGGVCCLASRCLPSSCPPNSPPRFLAQTLFVETSKACVKTHALLLPVPNHETDIIAYMMYAQHTGTCKFENCDLAVVRIGLFERKAVELIELLPPPAAFVILPPPRML